MSKSGQSYSETKPALCGRLHISQVLPCACSSSFIVFFFNPKHSRPQKSLHSIVKDSSTPHVRNTQFICCDEDEVLSLHSKYQVELQMRHTRAQLAELRLLADLKGHHFSNVNTIFFFIFTFFPSSIPVSSLHVANYPSQV